MGKFNCRVSHPPGEIFLNMQRRMTMPAFQEILQFKNA